MSAQAVGWVWRHSPYEGAYRLIHLALADVTNDLHGNELWISAGSLARKTRLSDRWVREGLHQMVSDGALEVVERPAGKPVRYRFVIPNPGSQFTGDEMSPLNPVQTPPEVSASDPGTDFRQTKENRKQPKGRGVVRPVDNSGHRPTDVAFLPGTGHVPLVTAPPPRTRDEDGEAIAQVTAIRAGLHP